MAIAYPLSLPNTNGIAQIELRAINSVALSVSPFTFSSQVHAYTGQSWQADVTLPSMQRDIAEDFITFLISLKGQYGTFYLGDPNATTPRGSARDSDNLIIRASASAGSDEIKGEGAPTGVSKYLKAGDYIQVRDDANRQLFKVLKDVDADGDGHFTVDVWPNVRSAIVHGGNNDIPIKVEDTTGVFRLSSNEQSYSINEASSYGISFGAVEAIT